MHDESAHLPETLNNATVKASLHKFARRRQSSSLDNALSTKVSCSNGDMVLICIARKEGSEKSAHRTVNRSRFWLPFGFCISRVH